MEIRRRTRRLLITTIAAASLTGSYVPEWTNFNESDPGITLIGAKATSDACTLSTDFNPKDEVGHGA